MAYEAIVIGAGGGGGVVACELAKRGVKVLLLEAGPWYGNKKWPNPNAEPGERSSSNLEDLSLEVLKRNFTDLENDMNDTITGKFRWGPANRKKEPWKRTIQNGGYSWQNAGVGGSTLHYFANSPRAFPQAINNVWPISYEELLPYYEKVESILPVLEAPPTAKERLFFYGAKQAGWEETKDRNVVSPIYRQQPNAILLKDYPVDVPKVDGESTTPYGCILRGNCVNGCHIGNSVQTVAKRSTFASYIPTALNTGNLEVRPNSFVTQILTKASTDEKLQATGVIYKNTWTGEQEEVEGTIVVMSGGGIETPRLWLNSNLPENPWVGKGLINHWFDCVSGIFDKDTLIKTVNSTNINPFVGQNAAARFDYPGLGVIETFGMSPGIFSSMCYGTGKIGSNQNTGETSNKLWDYEGAITKEKLKEFMYDYRRTLSVLIFTDDEVNQTNGVTLDYEHQDEYGYIPKITYTPNQRDKEKRDKLAILSADILRKAGAKTVIRANWPANIFIHIQSTMRMGYVTDTNCEAKQVNRLFIADNSVLYNGLGGPNPTLTTQALATRTAEKIVEKYL